LAHCRSEQEMNATEKRWIRYGREHEWRLCNVGDGGEGGCTNPESRKKLAAASKSNWSNLAYVAKWNRSMDEARARRRGLSVDEYRERRSRPEQKAPPQLGPSRRAWERYHANEWNHLKKTLTLVCCNGRAIVPLTRGKYAIVSKCDMDRVKAVRWNCQRKGKYLRAKRNFGGGRCELLSRFIVGAGKDQMVRHINGNQLDCTRSNLAIEQTSTTWRRPCAA
jgi:hypothetical protein